MPVLRATVSGCNQKVFYLFIYVYFFYPTTSHTFWLLQKNESQLQPETISFVAQHLAHFLSKFYGGWDVAVARWKCVPTCICT